MVCGKKLNKRKARKNVLRYKYLIKEIEKDEMIKQDSIRTGRRYYGKGQSK